jgi:hypothetical protein
LITIAAKPASSYNKDTQNTSESSFQQAKEHTAKERGLHSFHGMFCKEKNASMPKGIEGRLMKDHYSWGWQKNRG